MIEVLRFLPLYIVDQRKLSQDKASVIDEIRAYQLFVSTCTGYDMEAINIMDIESW